MAVLSANTKNTMKRLNIALENIAYIIYKQSWLRNIDEFWRLHYARGRQTAARRNFLSRKQPLVFLHKNKIAIFFVCTLIFIATSSCEAFIL